MLLENYKKMRSVIYERLLKEAAVSQKVCISLGKCTKTDEVEVYRKMFLSMSFIFCNFANNDQNDFCKSPGLYKIDEFHP